MGFRLVDADNFGGDYPNEKWACLYTFQTKAAAQIVADVLTDNLGFDERSPRYVKVVETPYELQPGFEP